MLKSSTERQLHGCYLGKGFMKYCRWILPCLLLAATVTPLSAQLGVASTQRGIASAQLGIIVRDQQGLGALNTTCALLGCQVSVNLGDPSGEVFLVTVDGSVNLNFFLTSILAQAGVL